MNWLEIHGHFLKSIEAEMLYAESLAGDSRFDELWRLMRSPLGYITLFPVARYAFESGGARMDGAARLFRDLRYDIDDDGEMCLVGCHIRHRDIYSAAKPLAFVVGSDRDHAGELVYELAGTHEPEGFALADCHIRRFEWDTLSFLVGLIGESEQIQAELERSPGFSEADLAIRDRERALTERIVNYTEEVT